MNECTSQWRGEQASYHHHCLASHFSLSLLVILIPPCLFIALLSLYKAVPRPSLDPAMRRSIILAALQQNEPSSPSHPLASPAKSSAASPLSFKKPSSSAALTARTANGGGFGPLLGSKPFKSPFLKAATRGDEGGRKRKRVDYKGMGAEGEDDDDDGDAGPDDNVSGGKRSKKAAKTLEGMYKGIDASGVSLNVDTRKWSVFKPKDGAMKRGFSLPSMKSKDGKIIELQPTYAALGTRRAIEIPPRPLHDPMGEHAIVLFDPTIDDAEAEREKERLRQEQDEQEKLSAQNAGPHKSLADLLGLNKKKTKVVEKVPVVIDPRLAKVLRPHQIEGVKVSQIRRREVQHLMRDIELTDFLVTSPLSSCTNVPLV